MDLTRATALACMEALNAGDEAAYLACFAPDGGQAGPLAGEGLRGSVALKSLFRHLQAELAPLAFRVTRYYSRGREAALVWTCEARPGGRTIAFDGITDISFAPNGRIAWAQVFWDPAKVLAEKSGRPAHPAPLPSLAQAWMKALEAEDPVSLTGLFSSEAVLEGMLSGGALRGPSVLARHMSHARRQLGNPHFVLESAYGVEERVALRWRAERSGHAFYGITVLDSREGKLVDRARMFWDPAEVAG